MSPIRVSLMIIAMAVAAWPTQQALSEDEAPKSPVEIAIKHYAEDPPGHFQGSIKRPKAEGGGMTQTIILGAGNSNPFNGDFELWRGDEENEEMVVVSKKFAPGFGIYVSDETTVTETRSVDDEPAKDVAGVRRVCEALLDARRLSKWFKKAQWERTSQSEDASTWQASVSRRIVPPSTQGMPGVPGARITEATATLTLSGMRISEIQIRVSETDPMAEMQRQAMRSGAPGMPPGMEMPEPNDKGNEVTYVLRPDSSKVSKRLSTFRARMRQASSATTATGGGR